MGWMSATVSTSMSFFISSSLISSVSARMDTTQKEEVLFRRREGKRRREGRQAKLTLHDHVGFGDGGEAAVQGVDLSRSKKPLKGRETWKHSDKYAF